MVPQIWSAMDRICCHFGLFLALLHPPLYRPPHPPNNNPQNENFEKMKKLPGDIIILHIHVHHKWRSYDISLLKYNMRQTEVFNILGHFLSFQPLATWKIKISTLKKIPGDIIILLICTINDNHMMYGSWDMERDRHNFFVILDRFLPFYTPLLTTPKVIILKKWEKSLEILSFYTSVP